jgi:hypothetical protein
LLRAASSAVRINDPQARVLSAGLAPTNEQSDLAMDDRDYLRAIYSLGGRDSFDILAAHPYGFTNPPDDPRGAHKGLNFARLQDLRDIMVANGDADKPVWITEFGYTTSPPAGSVDLGVTEEEQAKFLVSAFEIARLHWDWVQLFTVWNLADESPSNKGSALQSVAQGAGQSISPAQADLLEQGGFSVLRPDGSPKSAYAALSAMPKESAVTSLIQTVTKNFTSHPPQSEFPVLARDARVHLGDSEYPEPWVPLYQDRNPSTEWAGEFYLRPADLDGTRSEKTWNLTMELMQVNDYDSTVTVNDQSTLPAYLPTGDFTSIWSTARFQVPPILLRQGLNTIDIRDGKVFPSFQQLGFTWDDFQVRNVILTPP